MNYNHVSLGGNLVRDPELRYLPNGTACLDFTVANNRKWKSANGEPKEVTGFFGVVMFGLTAENFARYHGKGDRCFIHGRLTQDTWEKEGQKREKTKITADGFEFVNNGSRDSAPHQARPTGAAAPRPIDPKVEQSDDEDLPF